jgi:hypothetical protein
MYLDRGWTPRAHDIVRRFHLKSIKRSKREWTRGLGLSIN